MAGGIIVYKYGQGLILIASSLFSTDRYGHPITVSMSTFSRHAIPTLCDVLFILELIFTRTTITPTT